MTEAERTELVSIINREIITLTKKIDELKDFTRPVEPDCAIGRISRMDAINNKSVYDASLRNSRNRLKQLKDIFPLAKEDSFGICTRCHQSISIERMRIRPEVRLCAACLVK